MHKTYKTYKTYKMMMGAPLYTPWVCLPQCVLAWAISYRRGMQRADLPLGKANAYGAPTTNLINLIILIILIILISAARLTQQTTAVIQNLSAKNYRRVRLFADFTVGYCRAT